MPHCFQCVSTVKMYTRARDFELLARIWVKGKNRRRATAECATRVVFVTRDAQSPKGASVWGTRGNANVTCPSRSVAVLACFGKAA